MRIIVRPLCEKAGNRNHIILELVVELSDVKTAVLYKRERSQLSFS